MNSNPSDFMSYCSWAKNISGYREPIGDCFYGPILYYREFYAFAYTVGDAPIGLWEPEEDWVGLLHTLAMLPSDPESVPINALLAVKGTPLQDQKVNSSYSVYLRVCNIGCQSANCACSWYVIEHIDSILLMKLKILYFIFRILQVCNW